MNLKRRLFQLLGKVPEKVIPTKNFMKMDTDSKVKELNQIDESHKKFQYEIKSVPKEKIAGTQTRLHESTLNKYANYHKSHGYHPRHQLPTAIYHGGMYHVWDGHHRVAAEIKNGHKSVTLLTRKGV